MIKRFLPGALICVFLFLWICVAPMTLTVAMQPSFDRQIAEATAEAAGNTEKIQLRNTAEPTMVAQSAPLVASPASIAVLPTPDPAVAANERVQKGGNLMFILLAILIIGSYFMTTGNR